MARRTYSVQEMVVARLDKIETVLEKQNVILDDIKRQTTLTNGRVTVLEKTSNELIEDRKDIHKDIFVLQRHDAINETLKKEIVANNERTEKKTSDSQNNVRGWLQFGISILAIILSLIAIIL